MLKNNLARIGQVFRYFFVKYDRNIDKYALKNLSDKEYIIFKNMAEYDRVHCYKVAVEIEKKRYIFKENIWIRAALLHDCGKEKNIGLQLHYIPINKQIYYKNLGYGDEITPIMDKYYKEAISLPIYPNLSIDEQNYVRECLMEILK